MNTMIFDTPLRHRIRQESKELRKIRRRLFNGTPRDGDIDRKRVLEESLNKLGAGLRKAQR